MANATKQPDKTETVVVEKGGVTLELSADEAKTLKTVLGHVGTDSEYDTYPIYRALSDAGVEHDYAAVSTRDLDNIKVITFNRKK